MFWSGGGGAACCGLEGSLGYGVESSLSAT